MNKPTGIPRHFICYSLLLVIFLFSSNLLQAQLKWINYAKGTEILAMDQDGSDIWIGSHGGLVKVHKWNKEKTIYQAWNSPFQIKTIQSILVDDNGRRWFGSGDQGLMLLNLNNEWELIHEYNDQPLLEVNNISTDFNEGIWFTARVPFETAFKVYQYDGINVERHEALSLQNFVGIQELESTASGSIWTNDARKIVKYNQVQIVKSYDHEFFGLESNALFTNLTVDKFEDPWVYSKADNNIYKLDSLTGTWQVQYDLPGEILLDIFKDEAENLWIEVQYFDSITGFSKRRHYQYNDGNWLPFELSDFGALLNPTASGQLHYIDEQGSPWITQTVSGSSYPALFRNSNGEASTYDYTIFPETTFETNDLILDCDQLYWFMDRREIKKFDGSTWEKINVNPSFGNFRKLVRNESNCDVWIAVFGDQNKDVIHYNDGTIADYDLDHGRVRDINIRGNTVWAANGVYLAKLVNNQWEYFTNTPDSTQYRIEHFDFDQSGNIWFNRGNLPQVTLFDGNEFTTFDESNSPIIEDIEWFFSDDDGTMWMGNYRTYKYKNGVWEIHPFDFSQGITDMTKDADGKYWISHLRKGLIFWDGEDIFTEYNIENSDICTNLNYTVKVDPYGNKWLHQPTGTTFFNQNGLSFDHLPNRLEISGTVFIDTNQDGIYDPGSDIGRAGELVRLLPDNIVTFTDQNGQYTFSPEPGAFEIQYNATGNFFATSTNSLDVFFSHESVREQNFGIWSNTEPQEINLNINSGFVNCDEDVVIVNTLNNTTFNTINGNLSFDFPNEFTFVDATPSNYTLTGNTITWEYQDLPAQQSLLFNAILNAPGSGAAGNSYNFSTTAQAFDSNNQLLDETSATNTATINCVDQSLLKFSSVVGEQQGITSLLKDSLVYTIDFQNNEAETVDFVKIIDSLALDLDPASFKLLASSHPVEVDISNQGLIQFSFNDINLPSSNMNASSSKGFVQFAVLAKAGTSSPTTILNTAEIFMDFYQPITTNTTKNKLVDIFSDINNLTSVGFDFQMLPNPSDGACLIQLEFLNTQADWQITLINMAGKIVDQIKPKSKQQFIEALPSGVYAVEVRCEEKVLTKKLIIL